MIWVGKDFIDHHIPTPYHGQGQVPGVFMEYGRCQGGGMGEVFSLSPVSIFGVSFGRSLSCIFGAGRLHAWKIFPVLLFYFFSLGQNGALCFFPELGGFPLIIGTTHQVSKGCVVFFSWMEEWGNTDGPNCHNQTTNKFSWNSALQNLNEAKKDGNALGRKAPMRQSRLKMPVSRKSRRNGCWLLTS